MKRSDLDQVCDAGTPDDLKDRLATVLLALEGISTGDARNILRFAKNAVDDLPIISLMEKIEVPDQNHWINMTEQAFVTAVQGREPTMPNNDPNALSDRVAALERSILYGSSYGLAFAKYNLTQPKSFRP